MTDNKLEFLNTPGKRKTIAVAVSAALTGAGQSALGQGAGALEEVIVTATKRSANMQDIPQSVQAFTTQDIQRRGFSGIDDYSKQIPGISFSRREPAGTSIVFRGVASSGIQFGANPSSSIYLDEQPITAAGINPNPRLIDIERVEALSGPQGTLFGDASQSGTLRIITNKPKTDAFEAWIDANVNTLEDGEEGGEISGMVNLPVSDNVAIRLVGFTGKDAGYIDNVPGVSQGGTFTNAGLVDEDVNTRDIWGGRAGLRWDINPDWRLDISAIYQDVSTDGFGDVNTDQDDLEQLRFYDETLDEDWYQIGVTLEGSLGWADTTLSVSYFDRDYRYEADNSDYLFEFDKVGSYYPYYAFYDFGGDPRGHAVEDTSSDRWSVEARLTTPSDSDSKWAGLVGVFYSKTESETLFTSFINDFADTAGFDYLAYTQYYYTGTFPDATDNWFFGSYESELEQLAVFGEISYDITENLSITAGGRWYDITEDRFIWQGGLMQGSNPVDSDYTTNRGTSDEGDDGVVPKLNITYNFDDDKLVYATYSEGFRRGGGNVVRNRSVIPDSYDSDVLENIELGFKTEWLDGSLRVNAVAYHMVWDDFQVQANDPQPQVFSLGVINFPEAEVNGVEMDFAWVPYEGWTIDGSYSYIEAELSETATVFGDVCFVDGEQICEPVTATNGTQLPIAPEWKAAIGVEYQFNTTVFGAEPFVRLDWSHIDESVNALQGLESVVFAPAPTVQEAYDTFDLRGGLDGSDWSVTLYVDNVDDERGEVFYSNRWGKERLSVTQPRTYGLAFRKYFD